MVTYIVVGFIVAVIVSVSMSISKGKSDFEAVSKTSMIALIAGILWPIFVASMCIAIVGYCIIKIMRR